MKSSVHGKTMENLTNRIDVKIAGNKKDQLKWTPKLSQMSQKIFEHDQSH